MITKKEAIKNVENFKKALEEKHEALVTEFCENIVSKAIEAASCDGKTSCELFNALLYEKYIENYLEDIENYLNERGFRCKCILGSLFVYWE